MSSLLLVLFFQMMNKCRALCSWRVFFLILPYQRLFKQMIIDVSHIELPPADFFKSYEGSLKAMPETLVSYCISTFIIMCTDIFLWNICMIKFCTQVQSIASGWMFQGLFYNNVLLQPKLTKPESLFNMKWIYNWLCNNWFSLLCCLRVSWLLLLGLIGGEVVMVYELISDSVLHIDLLWLHMFRREAGKWCGWVLGGTGDAVAKLHSCFVPAGNIEIKGALHYYMGSLERGKETVGIEGCKQEWWVCCSCWRGRCEMWM